ncbi:hypothetical protein PPGU19_088980 (plasmid) [Paraburkholderia sp. PGU19]|nr:hypothetical protein PPGU19_088980 [Paraburkholderia sp. PGU19]
MSNTATVIFLDERECEVRFSRGTSRRVDLTILEIDVVEFNTCFRIFSCELERWCPAGGDPSSARQPSARQQECACASGTQAAHATKMCTQPANQGATWLVSLEP